MKFHPNEQIISSQMPGATYTAEALKRVRQQDLPMARDGYKYVMVFTDGRANDPEDLPQEADLLKKEVNEVFAFGIGDPSPDCDPVFVPNCVNVDELQVSKTKS